MIRYLYLAGLFLAISASTAHAESLWLVVGASSLSASEIAMKAKPLLVQNQNSLIIQTNDCGDKRNVFAWVAEIAASNEAAQAALARTRTKIKDAYVKRCDVKPGSLLALRFSVIDKSIADLPSDAVNWQEEDRVSSAQALSDGSTMIVVRYYVNDPEDPLEGRRERVVLADTTGKRTTLEDNCISPGRAVIDHGRIAFHCVREQAGDSLLHSVLAYKRTGEKLTEIQHCRNPKWSNEKTISCDAETVGSDGKLKLNEKRTDLTIKMK